MGVSETLFALTNPLAETVEAEAEAVLSLPPAPVPMAGCTAEVAEAEEPASTASSPVQVALEPTVLW